MDRKIRFGSYIREITIRQKLISYNDLVPEIRQDSDGNDIPYVPPKLKLRNIDIYRLVQPYVSTRLYDQIRAVLPLALYLVLFQLFILRQDLTDSWVITAGLVSVIIGLMLFMEGLKVGLMPFGETIGNSLPTKSPLSVVLTVTFLLGIGVTFAEPAIGALKTAGSIVDVTKAPYLYTLLNQWSDTLVLIVGMGVGLAAVLGTLRFIYGWSLKPFIYCTMIPTLGLTLYIMTDPELSKVLGLAWDCGAVTTGPVTVPLVLSLGIGIASSAGKGHSSLSGFGIVTLASLFPIIGVMMLAIFVSSTTSVDSIIASASQIDNAARVFPWYEQTPWQEMILGVRAIVPLVLFLIFVMYFILNEKIKNKVMTTYGISLCVIGMVVFNVGLSYGLAKLGGQSGGLVPAAFTNIALVENSPLYSLSLGISIAALFAWFLGLGATLAEPALNALGTTVENLTNGAFRKSMLMYAVSTGVAFGIAIGVLKIIFDIPIAYLLLPGYIFGLILTALSTEEFVNIAWDSAGVTTGPVTVPLVLAMGLGFGNAMGSVEGFGILSMASICPIIAVLSTGLWVQWKINRRHQADYEEENKVEATLV
ncbi:MAG: DUF1538 domain-containing protein [Gammaproteobacteria bacterium]|nr:MAG: DUF1538 domain-containing protein [Gammaproteobacteria bacterium]RKZ69473.1 MAG: DUF1538 domain-containing protein [Gammaproteobacteria bacterium]